MNGIIYVRVSDPKQLEGTSLASQEAACHAYAQAHGITVAKTFIELGESAKFADRTELLSLIDYCRRSTGSIQVLIVWKVDRFARNITDHYSIKTILAKYGVRVVSVTEPIDDSATGKFMESMLAAVAQFDNDIRALRTRTGMQRKIEEGIFPWRPPLGYRSPTRDSDKKTVPDECDPATFELLKRAWQLLATGSYTRADVRKLLTTWGVVGRRGRPLAPETIDHIFGNLYYAGILIDPWSGQEYPGRHVPMITRQEFAKVQQALRQRRHRWTWQKAHPSFPLRGLVRCPACQGLMTASATRGHGGYYPYYHCCRGSGCVFANKSYPAPSVHDEFLGFLGSVRLTAATSEAFTDAVLKVADEADLFEAAKRRRIDKTTTKLRCELQALIRMRTQGLIDDEQFKRSRANLTDERLALDSEPSRRTVTREWLEQSCQRVEQLLGKAAEYWQTAPVVLRQRFQNFFMPVGYVFGKSRTSETSLVLKAIGVFQTNDSLVVPLLTESWNAFVQELEEVRAIYDEYKTALGDL